MRYVKEQGKGTSFSIHCFNIWQQRADIYFVAQLSSMNCWCELVANRDIKALDVLAKDLKVGLVGAEWDESGWSILRCEVHWMGTQFCHQTFPFLVPLL